MSIDDLRSLAREFSTHAAECLGSRVYAIWLSGSLARGDFIENVSDLDLEMILKIGEEKRRRTDDMEELKDLTERTRTRALERGAREFDCFVFRLNDLKPKFHILELALFGEAMYGPSPKEVLSVGEMEKHAGELAMEFVREAARHARDVLEGRTDCSIASSVRLIMETDHMPAIVWNAREVPRAANFVTGKGVWARPDCFQVFLDTFPIHRSLVSEIWEYKLDQSRLRAKGESYVEDFLRRCLELAIDMEKRLTGRPRSQ